MSLKLDIPNPYKNGPTFRIPPFRLFGAGPTNPSPSVLNCLLAPSLTAFNKTFFVLTDEIKSMLHYIYQTNNPMTFVAQLSGNGANEAMVTNLADPGDTILVAVAGVWGKKFSNMGRIHNLKVQEVYVEPGEVYTLDALEAEVSKHKPVVLFITHGESSGGTLQPLEGIAEMCHKYDCLVAVDAVVSVGVVPLFVDRWQLDAVNGGTQKGIGGFPGMSLLTFSARAQERMEKKKQPPPYTMDMIAHGNVWRCFESTKPTYLYSFNSTILVATRQALQDICQEGLENVWERHQKCADRFMEKIGEMGLQHFVKKPENRFPPVTSILLPEDVDSHELLNYLLDKYEIELGVGIGPTQGKCIRVGFLANNAKLHLVDMIVEILEDGLNFCKLSKSNVPACRRLSEDKKLFVFYDVI